MKKRHKKLNTRKERIKIILKEGGKYKKAKNKKNKRENQKVKKMRNEKEHKTTKEGKETHKPRLKFGLSQHGSFQTHPGGER